MSPTRSYREPMDRDANPCAICGHAKDSHCLTCHSCHFPKRSDRACTCRRFRKATV